jgi:hypothetical protein
LIIFIIACITLCDFCGSLSPNNSPNAFAMICHVTPNLSFSQPHCIISPPADSFSHNSSTSSWVSQFTKNEIAGENLNAGPPFNAMNSCPSI